MEERSDYLARNQAMWTQAAPEYVERGRVNWAGPVTWGIFSVSESDVGLLPEVEGKDVLELGCGTGYVSSWIVRRGGKAIGLDPTWAQLQSAKSFQGEFEISFPLVAAAGEKAPFKNESFDVIISEYGASIWSDPYLWIPEAARLLRPGGELVFLVNGVLMVLCEDEDENVPATPELKRDYFGMHRFEWPGDDSVEFHLGYGDMIRLLRKTGFEILDLVEVRPPEDATTTYPFVELAWARRWPCEEIWKARKIQA